MSAAEMRETERALLEAYYDGELRRFSRWRFERRLRRSHALQRALAELEALGAWVRESEPALASPDLWDGIVRQLPALDARRREAESPRIAAGGLAPWLRPVGAVAAAAALVIALAIGLESGDTASSSVVRWLDSGSRSVVVWQGDADMTVIWVLDGSSQGARRTDDRATI